MKKIYLIIIILTLSFVIADAAQLSQAQVKAKMEIYNALKKYGHTISNIRDNTDEEMEFQYNGIRYDVGVHSLNPKILYLTLSASFTLPEEYNPEVANLAANMAASNKPVCAVGGRGVLMFSCEMYAKDTKPFIEVFPEMLQALSSSVDNFQNEYDRLLKEYFAGSTSGISPSLNHNGTVPGKTFSIRGNQIETTYHYWECKEIEVRDGQTILTKVVRPKQDGTYMYSSQEEFIEDAETGKKYYLKDSSIGFEGSPKISYDTQPITFYEVYPALPASVKKINISSGSQYYVKDLKIR